MPPFQPVPAKPDHVALEHSTLARWESERTFETLRDRNRGGPPFSFIDGPITANNPMGVHHGWGRTLKDIWQRYAAMRGCDLLLPERVRLPGPVGRGRRREGARPQLQARDRGVRPRAVRARLPRSRGALLGRAHRALQAARAVDGLGAVVLHDDRPQHLLHLGLPPGLQRARLALQGPPLDAVVPALRDVALAARADRLLQGPDPPVAARPHAARGPRPRVPGRVDDDAVDAPGERRRGGAADADYVRVETASGIAIVAAARLEASPIVGRVLGTVRGPSSSGSPTPRRSTSSPPRRASRTGSWPGTTSRWRRARASSTSRRAAARRTSSSASARASRR